MAENQTPGLHVLFYFLVASAERASGANRHHRELTSDYGINQVATPCARLVVHVGNSPSNSTGRAISKA